MTFALSSSAAMALYFAPPTNLSRSGHALHWRRSAHSSASWWLCSAPAVGGKSNGSLPLKVATTASDPLQTSRFHPATKISVGRLALPLPPLRGTP
jgi:hypothetical protein